MLANIAGLVPGETTYQAGTKLIATLSRYQALPEDQRAYSVAFDKVYPDGRRIAVTPNYGPIFGGKHG